MIRADILGYSRTKYLHDACDKVVGNYRPPLTNRISDNFLIFVAELFRNAAEAGPLDIVKLCKGDKLLNISTNLPANTPDSPYVLQVTIRPSSIMQSRFLFLLLLLALLFNVDGIVSN